MTSYKCIIGYRQKTVHVDKRLKYCPHGSCGVVISQDGSVHLISYETRVNSIDASGKLDCSGTYSATTRKHLGAFLKEYAPNLNYYSAKSIAGKPVTMDIHTGEIEPIETA